MKTLTLLQIAEWVDGALIQGTPSATVSSISTDSRKVAAGELFVALKGDRLDAHKFLGDVAGAGAAAMLVSALPPETGHTVAASSASRTPSRRSRRLPIIIARLRRAFRRRGHRQ